MKHVINIIGLFLLLLGFVMAADTVWGWALMSVPVMYWTLGFVLLVHKSPFAAIVFWSAVAYIQWEVALIAMMAFILFVGMRAVYSGGVKKIGVGRFAKKKRHNPATGLPMMGHKGMDVDSNGNSFNTF
ncbi:MULTISPECIES: hypothetical protein [Vibrio]|nr:MULTISPECIES: hypothetical protein [Vibrio]EHY9845497.1 hypothetical protein [Vibrio cholerae]MCS0096571.1 hypothetical protein [Vibrio cholerae]